MSFIAIRRSSKDPVISTGSRGVCNASNPLGDALNVQIRVNDRRPLKRAGGRWLLWVLERGLVWGWSVSYET